MSSLNGNYIFNKIFRLLDYNGEIAKSENVVGYHYTDKFSPNNIKRLIISPDMVIMNYHTALPNGKKQESVVLNPVEVSQAERLPDYKPMMNILSTKRICGSIEEIIFLTRSRNSNITLINKELDLENLVKGYGSRTNDIRGTISNRYKRLYALTIVNMNIDEFMFYMRQSGSNYEFISDLPFMANATKQYFHKDDWYESWGSAGQTYPLDMVGGVLHKHFSEIKARKKEQLKKEMINNYKSQANKSLVEEVKALYLRYQKMMKAYQRLYRMLKDIGYNDICLEKLTIFDLIPLYSCEAFSDYPKLQSPANGVDALKKNKELLQKGTHDLIGHTSRTLIKAVEKLCDKTPVTVKTLLTVENEYTVIVPNDVASLNEKIFEVTNRKYEGKSMIASYINFCWLYCSYFMNRNHQKFRKDYITKEYWEGVLR